MQTRNRTYISIRERKQTNRVVLLRYTYDPSTSPDLRDMEYVVLGSVERSATQLPPEIADVLTDEERDQFNEWVESRNHTDQDQQNATLMPRHYLQHAARHIGLAAQALSIGIEPVQPEQIWKALDVLKQELEKAGHPRSARGRGRPLKTDTPPLDDLVASPYDDPKAMIRCWIAEMQKVLGPSHNHADQKDNGNSQHPAKSILTPTQFREEIRSKGWPERNLADNWGISVIALRNIIRDANRLRRWDNMVCKLPYFTKKPGR